ncbi:MAG: hypothetical protein JST53_01595 [Actinobacteria bacterium]|nr:hypothetical protein [Actinomycetota bacterium]
MGVRRIVAAGMIVLACAVGVGTAFAAPVGGGKHFPHFGLLDERVAVKALPPELRIFVAPAGTKGFGLLPHSGHGPVWFGEVERPNATLAAVARGHWICQFELQKDGPGGGGGGCTSPGRAREFGLMSVSSCGKGPRHFRVHALLPDGVTGVEIEKEDGTVGRTLPVIDNTIAFTVGRENIALHGVGDAAAEGLERNLPLATVHDLGGRGGCSFYAFFEGRLGG